MKVIRKDHRNLDSIEAIINYIKSSPDRLPNFYFYGPTGCGKTRAAHEIAKALNDKVYNKAKSQYWRRYNGEKVVLIDDIKVDDAKYFQAQLTKWGDPFPNEIVVDGYYEKTRTDQGVSIHEQDVKRVTVNPSEYVLILASTKKPEFILSLEPEDQAKFDRLYTVIEITPEMFEHKEKRKSKQSDVQEVA